MRGLAVATMLGACNPAFGLEQTHLVDAPEIGNDGPAPPDRDYDGIPDPDDPCIASIADTKGDWDGDAYINELDTCPFGGDEAIDQDADGLCNEADPLPMLAGDHRRCLMAFQNIRLNRDLWVPRGDPATWYTLQPNGMVGVGSGALVASESFEAPLTTGYQLNVTVGLQVDMSSPGVVTLWLRTNDPAAAGDIGCEVRGDTSSSTISLRGGTSTQAIAQPIQRLTRIHAAIERGVTGRTNVWCLVQWGGFAGAVMSGEVTFVAGHVGFAVDNINTMFQTLMVTDRDDEPVL